MLYCSHLELKLHILEKAVEAVLSDLHDSGSTVDCDHSKMENIGQLIGLVYDLVVLDPSPNFDKKCSVKLLDGCIKLIEQLAIFGDNQEQYNKDIAMKTYGKNCYDIIQSYCYLLIWIVSINIFKIFLHKFDIITK